MNDYHGAAGNHTKGDDATPKRKESARDNNVIATSSLSSDPYLTSMRRPDLVDIIKRGEFGSVGDEQAVKLFGEQFGPELERLKNATSTIEASDAPTQGRLRKPSHPEANFTPSRLLFDTDYPEVNRTCVSMLALKWLVANDYKSFTTGQPAPVKMKEKSFDDLHKLVTQVLTDMDQLLALIVSIVVGDLGKDHQLAKDVKAAGGDLAEADNHDEVVYVAAELGMLEPLNLLSAELKLDVKMGLQVGSKLNIPQLAQAENVPGSLESVLLLEGYERAFSLKYLEILLDVAGAGGHENSSGAIRMIEPVYQAFTIGRKGLLDIIAGTSSLREGYDQVLRHRGELLEADGFRALSTSHPESRALLRLLAMGRVADQTLAQTFDAAFSSLTAAVRRRLVSGLNVDGYEDGEAIIPYYMPALFSEALRSTKTSSTEIQTQALASLMRFMARVYGGSRRKPGVRRTLCGARSSERILLFWIGSMCRSKRIPGSPDGVRDDQAMES